jgi:hypothetical protein
VEKKRLLTMVEEVREEISRCEKGRWRGLCAFGRPVRVFFSKVVVGQEPACNPSAQSRFSLARDTVKSITR